MPLIRHIGAGLQVFLVFTATTPPESSTLSLHDALPILNDRHHLSLSGGGARFFTVVNDKPAGRQSLTTVKKRDRKSTRLNSSHVESSYAVFCLKKKSKGRP